jgi:hypothetical protein
VCICFAPLLFYSNTLKRWVQIHFPHGSPPHLSYWNIPPLHRDSPSPLHLNQSTRHFQVISFILIPLTPRFTFLYSHSDGFLKITDGSTSITFGALGYCTIKSSGYVSPFNQPTSKHWPRQFRTACSSAHVGYDIAAVVSQNTGIQYTSTVLYNLSRGLVLHPVLTGLSFFALLIAFGASCCGFIIASAIAAFSWVLTLVVLVIDFSMFGAVKVGAPFNNMMRRNSSVPAFPILESRQQCPLSLHGCLQHCDMAYACRVRRSLLCEYFDLLCLLHGS